ncbi:MAG TPA: hypothetical protein PK268_01380 [Enterococcus sp.]|nr:hypothetical protein [Enterococcus sp.]
MKTWIKISMLLGVIIFGINIITEIFNLNVEIAWWIKLFIFILGVFSIAYYMFAERKY